MRRIKVFSAMLIILMLISPVFSESTPVPGLSFFKLDNGLELFVLENHAVPLTRIQITFRCGAITQTPETCGIFHLYEHMLFKGNKNYQTETQFSAAMTELGVAGWNGGTSTEYVTYYITLPSDKTDKGLELWSHAMRYPLFDKEELEIEKDIVCNEINGKRTDPSVPIAETIIKKMFSKYPWRQDINGYEKLIRAATPEMLREIQKTYYIPNNAAIFVAGDVNPTEVYNEVKKYYGDWERGKDPWNPMPDPQAFPAVQEPLYLVYPDPSFYKGIAIFFIHMRGPDTVRDPKSTYAAAIWSSLYKMPLSLFKKNIFKAVPNLYGIDDTLANYYPQRDGGEIVFGTAALIDHSSPTGKRAKAFQKAIYDEITKTKNTGSYFEKKEFEIVKRKLEDTEILDLERPDTFIKKLSFCWASTSAGYFFNYLKNINKVTKTDIDLFLQKYILKNHPIVIVRMNNEDYKKEIEAFKRENFNIITGENCFWWGDTK